MVVPAGANLPTFDADAKATEEAGDRPMLKAAPDAGNKAHASRRLLCNIDVGAVGLAATISLGHLRRKMRLRAVE